MMEITKALKCYQNLYQVVVCPWPGVIYMFEVVKKTQNLFPCKNQVSGERYRAVGPLVDNVVLNMEGFQINDCDCYVGIWS